MAICPKCEYPFYPYSNGNTKTVGTYNYTYDSYVSKCTVCKSKISFIGDGHRTVLGIRLKIEGIRLKAPKLTSEELAAVF
jgi:hypothetical protein